MSLFGQYVAICLWKMKSLLLLLIPSIAVQLRVIVTYERRIGILYIALLPSSSSENYCPLIRLASLLYFQVRVLILLFMSRFWY